MKFNNNFKILAFCLGGIVFLFFIYPDTTISESNSNGGSVGGGVWVHSKEMNTINLDSVQKQNITNIYLHSNVLNKYSDEQLQKFIKECHERSINVHLWVTVFRYDDKFHIPNQDVIKARLDLVQECSNVPNIDGINLDYMRYDGKNPELTNETVITDFVKKTSEIAKSKSLELSVCLMPEKDEAIRLYGQNAKELSKYVDVLIPMLYKGNYNKDTEWIRETSKYYVSISDCKVAPAILTYYSDDNTAKLSISELKNDIKAVYDGGADGCSLFKYNHIQGGLIL